MFLSFALMVGAGRARRMRVPERLVQAAVLPQRRNRRLGRAQGTQDAVAVAEFVAPVPLHFDDAVRTGVPVFEFVGVSVEAPRDSVNEKLPASSNMHTVGAAQ